MGAPKPMFRRTKAELRASFRGTMSAPTQAAILGALAGALMVVVPTMGGLLAVGIPMALQRIRQRGAPSLVLEADQLVLERGSQRRTVARDRVLGASVRRTPDEWVLVVDTAEGELEVTGTGTSPVDLQWFANAIERWVRRDNELPDQPDRVVDEGAGATSFVLPLALGWDDWAVLVGGSVGVVAAEVAGLVYHQPVAYAAVPLLAAVLAHLATARQGGVAEVRLSAQSVRLRIDQPRVREVTIALEDLADVRVDAGRVVLVERSGRVHRFAPRRGTPVDGLVDAIRGLRRALPPPSPDLDEDLARLRELAGQAQRE